MKMLYLIRHAKSSWDFPHLKDIERPLGKRGLRDAPFMAKMLSGKGVKADKLVSSPAKRAHTTAVYFSQAQGISPEDILLEPAVYHAFGSDVLAIARDWPDHWNTVFLFGHNPTFTTVANYFSDDYIDNVPTCGIVGIEMEVELWNEVEKGRGRVRNFWYPKQFK